MTKADLEARRALLQADRDNNAKEIANLQQQIAQRAALDHTLNGAIQEADYWIERAAKEEIERQEAERIESERKSADLGTFGVCAQSGCPVCAPHRQST